VARKIRFSAAEWEVVETHARACGRAPARHVREVALGVAPKVSRTRAHAPIIRELSGLATELRRARAAISGRMIEPSDGADPTRIPDGASVLERAVERLLAIIGKLA
jgi:hypothetical protein